MVSVNLIEEKPLTLGEIKKELEKVKKRDKELNFRANKVKEYLDIFTKLKIKDVDKLKKELQDINIPRLKDRHIIKTIDITPDTLDDLKILFTGESITLKQEDLVKILEVIQKYKNVK